MPVSIALVGPAAVGKTTLFQALTRGRGHDGVGMVDVPDERLDRLAAVVKPKKVVPAQVRLVDAPPGSPAQRIAAAREADVLIEVARCFGAEPQPVKDVEDIELDLVLADLASVERRLELLEKEARVGKKQRDDELTVLATVKNHLEQSKPLHQLPLGADQLAMLAPLFLVSLKPAQVVANLGDDLIPDGGEPVQLLVRLGREPLLVSAQLELELAALPAEEAEEYRKSYGLHGSGLAAIAAAVWKQGGLITFFTAGEPEVRAWPVEANAAAPVAAGVIHSDFERNFIRAEVASVEELVEAGSMEALRAEGRLRIEGRDYRVQDGDVVLFRVGR